MEKCEEFVHQVMNYYDCVACTNVVVCITGTSFKSIWDGTGYQVG